MIYILLGQEPLVKDQHIKRLIRTQLTGDSECFNCDIFHAADVKLLHLQERMKALPVEAQARVIVIKSAHKLPAAVKEYLVNWSQDPYEQITLILDMEGKPGRDTFLDGISRRAKVVRFKEEEAANAFMLTRQIQAGRTHDALRMLHALLDEGERPERILGAVRYAVERKPRHPDQARGQLKLLLECDRQIKTGILKPPMALEKLVLALSGC